MPIIECVPNFSEGKNSRKINEIAKAIKKIEGVDLLEINKDPDHNRSVMTFIGEPEKVLEAAFQAVKKAAELINIKKHKGIHPRIGATDVLPLIPLKGISYKECVKLAKKLGKRIGEELKIPIYLYEKAATKPERKNLANTRKEGYEKFKPDFGPRKAGKAGATMLGVRPILIAFNVNLKTNDLSLAKKIAKLIREKDGGLPYVKALGLPLKSRKIVQISMNLTNYKKTPPLKVYEAIKKHAEILESEVVGMIPESALPKNYKKSLKLKDFNAKQILQNF